MIANKIPVNPAPQVMEAYLDDMRPSNVSVFAPLQSDLDKEVLTPPPLYTTGGKQIGPRREKPVHRTIAYMLLSGASQATAAQVVGVVPATISRLVNMDWFRQILAELAHVSGGSDVMELLQSASAGAAAKLIELSTSSDQKVALAANNSILDRVLGKAVTRVQRETVQVPVDPREELEQLDQEVAQLQQRLTLTL